MPSNPSFARPFVARLLSCGLLLLATACTTVPAADVATFRQGVGAPKLQLDTSFATINQMATQDEIDRAITLDILHDDDVPIVLKPDDIAKWDRVFGKIDQYAVNLTLLISPDNANEFGDATVGLASAIAQLKPDALPSAGVSTALAEFGRILIEVKAQHDAVAAARTADPGIQQVFKEMAAAIGETSSEGLRGTVSSHWLLRLADQRAKFTDAAKGEARRPIVQSYIDLRNRRDAQDLQLSMLRQSILDLAAAHGALARGSNIDLQSAVALVEQELNATQALAAKFQAVKPKTEGQ